MNNTYAIKINSAKDAAQTVQLKTGEGQPVVVKVNGHANVELTDNATGRAPQKVSARRVGKDLQVAFEGGDPTRPDLILQDFYGEGDNHLVGLAESGQYFEYIPASGESNFYVPLLAEGVEGIQVLGGEALAGAAWSPMAAAAVGMSPWALAALGLGAAAVAAVAIRKNDDTNGGSSAGGAGGGSGGDTIVPGTPTARPTGYTDNVGAVQNLNSTAATTDDNTPGLRIGALPAGATGAVLYVDGVPKAATYDAVTGTLTPTVVLTEGPHTLGYGLITSAGTTPSSPTIAVTIDTTAPTAPQLVVNDINGDGRPDISGTAEAGSKVTITDPSGATHTTIADGSGKYSLEIPAPTPLIGPYTAIVTDTADNVSPKTTTVVTDLTAPPPPTVVVRDSNGDGRPNISGTAEAGSTVTITDPAGVAHTATANGSGNYSLEIAAPTPLTGDYKGTATDASKNVSPVTTTKVTDLTAPAAPSFPDLDAADDTGLSNTDNITSKTSGLTFTGTAEAGATVTLFKDTNGDGAVDPGESLGVAIATGGNWSIDASLADSGTPYNIKAIATDPYGNTGKASTGTAVTIDASGTTLPGGVITDPLTKNSVAVISITTDTGVSATDFNTSDQSLLFKGTSDAPDGTNVQVMINNIRIGYTKVFGGLWTYDHTTVNLESNIYSVRADLIDTSGGVAKSSAAQALIIDTSGKLLPGSGPDPLVDKDITVGAITPDTGLSATDFITSEQTLIFSGTSNAADGSNVQVMLNINNTTSRIGFTTVLGGVWTFDYSKTSLSPGTYIVSADLIDPAGGVANSSIPKTMIIQIASPMAPSKPDLDASDDTGVSNSDDITSKTSGLTFMGTAEAGATVTLFKDTNGNDKVDPGESLGVATATGGNWSIDAALAESLTKYEIKSIAANAAGVVGSASEALKVLIDTTPPIAPSQPDLDASDDTGVSNSDNITSKTSGLTFTGTAEAGSTVILFKDIDGNGKVGAGESLGMAVATSGNWSIDASLADSVKPYNIRSIATDLAGLTGSASPGLDVHVNSTAPTAPSKPDLDASDDTGVSNSDDITSKTSGLTFTGTAEAGATVTLFKDTNGNDKVDPGESLGVAIATGGNWSIDAALAESLTKYEIKSIATNAAGVGGSVSEALKVLIDTTPPIAPSQPDLDASDDTGVSNSDNITSKTTGLTFTGTAEAGSTVILFKDIDDNGEVGSGESLGMAVATGGNWSIDASLADSVKPYNIRSIATDLAGLTGSASPGLDVTVNSTGPTAPSMPDLAAIDDTGISSTDDITMLTSGLTFTGTATAGSTVTLFKDTNGNGSVDPGESLGTAVATGGNWSIDAALAESTTPYKVRAVATNAAGVTGQASDIVSVVIDTTAPTPPSAPDLAAFDDSGLSSTDNITNQTSLTFTGTGETGSFVTIFNDADDNNKVDAGESLGTATVVAGSWTIDAALVGAAKPYSIKSIAGDVAGNPSSISSGLAVTVDTTAPTQTATILTANDNVAPGTGNIPSGGATNDTTLDFTGTLSAALEAGSVLNVYDGTSLLGQATVTGTTWTFTSPVLSDKTHTFTAQVMDVAANTGTSSAGYVVTVDTAAPVFTSNPNAAIDENTAAGTVIYNATATDASGVTYAITGGADAGRFSINANTGQVTMNFKPDYEAPVDSGNNNVYDYTITATDGRGNTSTQNATLTVRNVAETPTINTTMSAGDGFWVMSGGGTNLVRNNFLVGKLSSDMPVTYTTNIPFIHVTPNGEIYTQSSSTIQSGKLISASTWRSAFGGTSDYTFKSFQITATSASGESTVINAKIAIYNNISTPGGYPGYVTPATNLTPFVPPVALDLNQDGHISYAHTAVDVDGNGLTHTTAWTSREDGVLIWDKYHDGRVHDSTQYAFAQYLAGAKTDLEGLKAFDTNANGKLDKGDAIWNEMRVWQDLNRNGVSDAGEVKTLAQWGIASIDLNSDGVVSQPMDGVQEAGKASATLEDGSQMVVADVAIASESAVEHAGVMAKPFILDLNHDGQISYSKALLDLNGTGTKKLVGWVGADDGVLVWDKYHDGQVHDSSQYSFGAPSGDNATLQGLKIFDTNSDGKLDSHDVLWNELNVWQDANGNGVSDAGEVRTLTQLGVQSISLTSDGVVSRPAEGVAESGKATATLESGQTMLVSDAAFSYITPDALNNAGYLESSHAVL